MHANGYAGFEDLYHSGAIREVACSASDRVSGTTTAISTQNYSPRATLFLIASSRPGLASHFGVDGTHQGRAFSRSDRAITRTIFRGYLESVSFATDSSLPSHSPLGRCDQLHHGAFSCKIRPPRTVVNLDRPFSCGTSFYTTAIGIHACVNTLVARNI
jgi:hypothetical protein